MGCWAAWEFGPFWSKELEGGIGDGAELWLVAAGDQLVAGHRHQPATNSGARGLANGGVVYQLVFCGTAGAEERGFSWGLSSQRFFGKGEVSVTLERW
jgi:hypothetical protein